MTSRVKKSDAGKDTKDNSWTSDLLKIALTAIITFMVTHYGGEYTHKREIKTNIINKLEDSSQKVHTPARSLLSKIENGLDLKEDKERLSSFAHQQLIEIEAISPPFKAVPQIFIYREALVDFSKVTVAVRGAEDIQAWSHAFDRLLEAREALVHALKAQQGW